MEIAVVATPVMDRGKEHYLSNRPPLHSTPLAKLPLGSVRPQGWLHHQLRLMVDGMTSHLVELSGFLAPENGWFGGDQPGWEEQPYWLRGFYDLDVLTGGERLRPETARWIEAVIESQHSDGCFGAGHHKRVVASSGVDVNRQTGPGRTAFYVRPVRRRLAE